MHLSRLRCSVWQQVVNCAKTNPPIKSQYPISKQQQQHTHSFRCLNDDVETLCVCVGRLHDLPTSIFPTNMAWTIIILCATKTPDLWTWTTARGAVSDSSRSLIYWHSIGESININKMLPSHLTPFFRIMRALSIWCSCIGHCQYVYSGPSSTGGHTNRSYNTKRITHPTMKTLKLIPTC